MAAQYYLTNRDLALIIQGWKSDPLEAAVETKARTQRVLEKSHCAKIYLPQLEAKLPLLLRQIESQPETIGEATTLLGEAQELLDNYEWSLEQYCRIFERAPGIEEPRRLSAQKVREAFVPDRIKRSYADQASQVPMHTQALTRLTEDLERLGPDGHRFAQGQVAQETRIAQLLDTRQTIASGLQGSPSSLRMDVLRLLNELRTALKSELVVNPELPPDAEALVFSTLDNLAERRQAPAKPDAPTA